MFLENNATRVAPSFIHKKSNSASLALSTLAPSSVCPSTRKASYAESGSRQMELPQTVCMHLWSFCRCKYKHTEAINTQQHPGDFASRNSASHLIYRKCTPSANDTSYLDHLKVLLACKHESVKCIGFRSVRSNSQILPGEGRVAMLSGEDEQSQLISMDKCISHTYSHFRWD